MQREKRQTKKERKAAERPAGSAPVRRAQPAAQGGHQHQHIHCIACGKHLDANMFGESADFIRCEHGSDFAHCTGCVEKAKALVSEHDRTNQPVKKAAAWH
jgi:hypothetical protein